MLTNVRTTIFSVRRTINHVFFHFYVVLVVLLTENIVVRTLESIPNLFFVIQNSNPLFSIEMIDFEINE